MSSVSASSQAALDALAAHPPGNFLFDMFVLPFVEHSVFQSEPCLRVTDVEQGVILVMLSQPLGTGIAGT